MYEGWVQRERDEHDQRAMRLRLTAAGTELSERMRAARSDKFVRLLDAIPPNQRDQVIDAIRILARASRLEPLT